MRKVLIALLVLALSVLGSAAHAQFRALPQNAQRGTVNDNQWPLIQIGWTVFRMAPGAVIWDQNNRTITPNFLPAGADIVFTLNPSGDIARIYVLTPQEQEALNR